MARSDRRRTRLIEYSMLLIGAFSLALGVVLLKFGQIPGGGPPGVAILLNYLFAFSPGISMAVINTLLMSLGFKILGKQLFIRSLGVVILTAGFVDGLLYLLPNLDFINDRLLIGIYSGAFLGIGMGMIFKAGAASGGGSVLAKLISIRIHIPVGICLIIVDVAIVAVSTFVFNDFEAGMLGALVIFICGRCIDFIVSGASEMKMVHISTFKAELLKQAVYERAKITSSIIHTDSLHDEAINKMLVFYIQKSQLLRVQHIINELDPQAMLTVHNVQQP